VTLAILLVAKMIILLILFKLMVLWVMLFIK
jgi:hypothetical protein